MSYVPGDRVAARVLAFSRDGQRVVTGGKDRAVRVWDALNGTELFTFRGHTLPVEAVAISRDGTRVVSSSGDGSLRVWGVSVPPDSLRLLSMNGVSSSIGSTSVGQRILVGSP